MKNSKALTLLIFLELEWQYLQVRTPVQNWSQELKFIVITQHGSSLLTCRANVSAMRLQGIILLVPLILLFASYPKFGWIKNVRKNIHVLWLKKYEKVLRLIIINNHDFHKKKKKISDSHLSACNSWAATSHSCSMHITSLYHKSTYFWISSPKLHDFRPEKISAFMVSDQLVIKKNKIFRI